MNDEFNNGGTGDGNNLLVVDKFVKRAGNDLIDEEDDDDGEESKHSDEYTAQSLANPEKVSCELFTDYDDTSQE